MDQEIEIRRLKVKKNIPRFVVLINGIVQFYLKTKSVRGNSIKSGLLLLFTMIEPFDMFA